MAARCWVSTRQSRRPLPSEVERHCCTVGWVMKLVHVAGTSPPAHTRASLLQLLQAATQAVSLSQGVRGAVTPAAGAVLAVAAGACCCITQRQITNLQVKLSRYVKSASHVLLSTCSRCRPAPAAQSTCMAALCAGQGHG